MVDTPFLRSLGVGSLRRPKQITTNWMNMPSIPTIGVGDALGSVFNKAKDATLAYPRLVSGPNTRDPMWPSMGGPGKAVVATPSSTSSTTPSTTTTAPIPVPRPNTGIMQGPIIGNDARVTAWDTDPRFQVLNKLTQEEFMRPFQTKDPQQIVKNVVEVVINKIAESGYEITPEFETWMKENAQSATADWAQAQKRAGKEHILAAEYYMMMAEFAISGAQQFAQSPSSETTTETVPAETAEPSGEQVVDGSAMTDEEIQRVYLVWATNRQQSQPGEPVDFQSFLAWLDEQEGSE